MFVLGPAQRDVDRVAVRAMNQGLGVGVGKRPQHRDRFGDAEGQVEARHRTPQPCLSLLLLGLIAASAAERSAAVSDAGSAAIRSAMRCPSGAAAAAAAPERCPVTGSDIIPSSRHSASSDTSVPTRHRRRRPDRPARRRETGPAACRTPGSTGSTPAGRAPLRRRARRSTSSTRTRRQGSSAESTPSHPLGLGVGESTHGARGVDGGRAVQRGGEGWSWGR